MKIVNEIKIPYVRDANRFTILKGKFAIRKLWLAYNKEEIIATWYDECIQPFKSWREAVKNIAPNAIFTCTSVTLKFK